MSADPSFAALPDVSAFIRSCVERAGGAVEERSRGRLDALLPPPLETAAGGRSWVRLALSAGDREDGVEPALLGSPFLDALIAFATARGTVASGRLPAGRLKKRGLREEVQGALLFTNCRTRYGPDEADVMLAATAQFDFKVAFLSEERRERLYVVPVNLFTNAVQPQLAERLGELPIEESAASEYAEAPTVPIAAAYETACDALRCMVAAEAARRQVRVAQRFAVELGRVREYYGRLIADLERRRAHEVRRAPAGPGKPVARKPRCAPVPDLEGEPGPRPGETESGDGDGFPKGGVVSVLDQKIDSARRERERKLRELGETYGMRVRARLTSARCLWQPKSFFKISIDRGPITRPLLLSYDGLLERLEPPTCESCRHETNRLWASPAALLLCPACAGR